jgi:hypothetical protein
MTSTDALQISRQTYRLLKPETIRDILSVMGLEPRAATAETAEQPSSVASDGLVRFNERDWRKFLDGVSPKTREALNVVADLGPRYDIQALLDRLRRSETFGPKVTLFDLRGVAAGLTKRTRTIARTDEELFHSVTWNDDNSRECIVEWAPTTHAALRRALGKD